VERPSNASALQRLVGAKFLADGHETWHLVLSKSNLVATCLSKREVGNTVLEGGGS
jgi:hypothetical protein